MKKDNIHKIKELIESAHNILVVSHASPDPDAVSCTLFTYNILKKNFPNKKITANIEAAALDSYGMLLNIQNIETNPFLDTFNRVNPDLLIVLDLSNPKLIMRSDIEEGIEAIRASKVPMIIIDHHENENTLEGEVIINEGDGSCAETVYRVFIEELKFNKYDGYANELLLGIIGDTGQFRYLKHFGVRTFDVTGKLLADGGNIDKVVVSLNRLNNNEVEVNREMMKNLISNGVYTYTYISDMFFKEHPEISDGEYSVANKIFVQYYLKTIGSALWGFTFKPLKAGGYTVSFRSEFDLIDLTVFAKFFGGGGHKTSAGGIIFEDSDRKVLEKILSVVEEHKEEAIANR
ncbi:DHH family phosphoesterase [Candidatus Dojkabacteria bacterium]|nr:DHH family phosphoesterase [Candidatus Dojkabacteria bacterium]